jgi:starch-binding outer membrane protein, SusD/RagB family
MRTYHSIAICLIIATVIIIPVGCKKFVDIKPPADRVIAATVFSNDETAVSAVTGIYGRMMQTLFYCFNGSASIDAGLSADEIYNTMPDLETDQFTSNSLNAGNDIIKNSFWDALYNYIYHGNACLEGLNASDNLSPSIKQQLIGETKFIRALCYFYLANFYGDVPMELTTDYRVNSIMPRTPAAKIYEQIISDLKDAQNNLSADYVSSDRARPNKWAATSLLARVYLYQKDWINAEGQASMVINSGNYELLSNPDNVFLFDSNETIWQLQTILGSYKTAEGNAFNPYPASAIPNYALTDFLVNAFEPDDLRKTSWVAENIVNGQSYLYPYKYKVKYSFLSTLDEYNIVLRYSEMFLIRAEARAEQNNIPGAQADLNMIRNRAGLSNTTADDLATLLGTIEHERQIELFAEWGHRWLDLKRTNRANAVFGIEKAPNWQAEDALYPIPRSQIQLNPFLTQNPGY